jgi:hypothetical protein
MMLKAGRKFEGNNDGAAFSQNIGPKSSRMQKWDNVLFGYIGKLSRLRQQKGELLSDELQIYRRQLQGDLCCAFILEI